MSTTVDQFCDTLRDRLNVLGARIRTANAEMQALSGQAEKVVRAKLEEARTSLQSQKERIEQARANLKARGQQKIVETKEAISEWKAKREIQRLQARADRAEAYAADAIALATASISEAEEAILDAMVARIDAEAAQSPQAPQAPQAPAPASR